jgi:hypothetical protein
VADRDAAGLIATGLVLGAVAAVLLRTAGEWVEPGDAIAANAPAKPAAAARTPAPAPKVVAAKPAPPAAAAPSVKPGAVKPVAPAKPGAPAPARPAVKPVGVQTVAHLDDQVMYQYNALGRRDPFQAIVGGEYLGDDVGGDAPVDVGGIKVVGIVWGASDKFALVEDGRGNSLVLREGDKVMNGVVEGLKRDAVVVKLTSDDQTQSVTIPVMRKGDLSNAKR